MNAKSLLIASAIAVGLAMPATAQQSTTMHRYVIFFKYTDQAIPGDQSDGGQPAGPNAAAAKLAEAFGVKPEVTDYFPMGGEFDAMAIGQAPSDLAIEGVHFVGRSSGAFA
jgi:uncharacterized protein with GYD domain